MSNGMKGILDFCKRHQLVDGEDAARIACMHDRQFDHPIRIMLQYVEEQELYTAAAAETGLELTTPDRPSHELLSSLQPVVLQQFDIIPTAITDNELHVVTWNWTRATVIPQALQNITGKQTTLKICTCSDFDLIC